jgi:predicted DNA-binding transcriptional regulator AlpA
MSVQMSVPLECGGVSKILRIFVRRVQALNHLQSQKVDGFGKTTMDQLLRISDLQRLLFVSRSTVYRFLRASDIPVVYVMGSPRVSSRHVQAALLSKGGNLR